MLLNWAAFRLQWAIASFISVRLLMGFLIGTHDGLHSLVRMLKAPKQSISNMNQNWEWLKFNNIIFFRSKLCILVNTRFLILLSLHPRLSIYLYNEIAIWEWSGILASKIELFVFRTLKAMLSSSRVTLKSLVQLFPAINHFFKSRKRSFFAFVHIFINEQKQNKKMEKLNDSTRRVSWFLFHCHGLSFVRGWIGRCRWCDRKWFLDSIP